MNDLLDRVAGAPITWGVCEVPGWGFQLDPDRVLREMRAVGLRATELGPEGFLPRDPNHIRRLVARYELRVVAGFVPLTLHRATSKQSVPEVALGAARLLSQCGADVMVVAAASGVRGYEGSAELDDGEWRTLTETLDQVIDIGAEHALNVALHPHYGTVIDTPETIKRLIESSPVSLCIDTGHLTIGGADPVEVAVAAGDRVAHVHLKDVDRGLAEDVRAGALGYRDAVQNGLYRPLGAGDVDVASIVTLLENSGYRGWYVLEQDTVLASAPNTGRGPVEEAAQSLEHLRQLAGANR
jgi:inosose dehydratase